eukprot:5172684-Prymnesium_polylepis.2
MRTIPPPPTCKFAHGAKWTTAQTPHAHRPAPSPCCHTSLSALPQRQYRCARSSWPLPAASATSRSWADRPAQAVPVRSKKKH